MNADEWTLSLQALLPPGAAWPRDPDAVLTHLLAGCADGLSRIDGRALDLLEEADPRATFEMLGDWETEAGLPDLCTGQPETLQERRAQLVGRITGRGGQSRAYYIALAATLGFGVTIEEHGLFRADAGQCDITPLNEDGWAYAWTIHAPETTETLFRGDQSTTEEPLLAFGNRRLECAIRRASPAHTVPLFAYGG